MSVYLARAILEPEADLAVIADYFARWMKMPEGHRHDLCPRHPGLYPSGTLEVPQNEWSAGNGGYADGSGRDIHLGRRAIP
jgi:hypothetical protein